MDTRRLGSTGLRVSALSFGTMTFGGQGLFSLLGSTQLEEAQELVGRCLDAGVNLFDTADFYSGGMSEEILGRALGSRRDDALIASKVHMRTGEGANDVGLSRHHIVQSCEATLRRLGTDRIDLYQAHGFDAQTPLEETLRAFDDLVRAGKVRYVGCSNLAAWQLMKALHVSDRERLERYVSLQAYYSLVARELEHELVPACLDEGVGVLVWSPLAGGFLSGKYRRGRADPDDGRRSRYGDFGNLDVDQGHDIVDVLCDIAHGREVSIAQAALNWLLQQPGVSSVVIGARTPEQLTDNLGAADWELDDDEIARLDAVSSRPLPYPHWHHVEFNAERRLAG